MQSQSSKVSEKVSPKHTKRILNQQHSSNNSSRPQNQKERREKKEKN
jgi:hypothetical protein